MKLRCYQKELVELSSGTDNVLIQADTGAGKTPVISELARMDRYVLCIAHTNILVKQLSRMLAKFNIVHGVLATKYTQRQCIIEHRKLDLENLFDQESNKHIVSIDSLISRFRRKLLMIDTQNPWVILVDEAHHMVDNNKWGKLLTIFPNARVIGVTATPCRLDQQSLARKKGGVFDRLIQASKLKQDSVRTLIEMGYLSDFKAYSVPERINTHKLKLGKYDFTYKSLEAETNKVVYEMAGDAVKHYKRLAKNKQALAFCVSIDIAQKTAEKFRKEGVPAAAIHSKQSATESARIFDLFEKRIIKVLVNVNMIGEGVDVPAIECLIMLRKTASFALIRQWCGRSLRPEENKPFAILIDHVGNLRTHGLPDLHVNWDLENPPQAKKTNLFPCPECFHLVDAWMDECPECGSNLKRAVDAKTETDVIYIDYDLVEIERRKIDENIKKEAIEKDLRENLVLLGENVGCMGGLAKSVHKIKMWFAEVMQEHKVSIYDLNMMFMKESGTGFWVSNFTFRDLNQNNDKCLKVYEKWARGYKNGR